MPPVASNLLADAEDKFICKGYNSRKDALNGIGALLLEILDNGGLGGGAGDMLAANNLSDVVSAATSRANLGLGTAAVEDVGFFATAAQGALADTALQPSTVEALTPAGSVNLDFADADDFFTLSISANLTLTTSNLAAGRSKTLKILCDGTPRTFTLPAWIFVGAAAPTGIAASKTAILTLTAFGAADANVVAAYAEQP